MVSEQVVKMNRIIERITRAICREVVESGQCDEEHIRDLARWVVRCHGRDIRPVGEVPTQITSSAWMLALGVTTWLGQPMNHAQRLHESVAAWIADEITEIQSREGRAHIGGVNRMWIDADSRCLRDGWNVVMWSMVGGYPIDQTADQRASIDVSHACWGADYAARLNAVLRLAGSTRRVVNGSAGAAFVTDARRASRRWATPPKPTWPAWSDHQICATHTEPAYLGITIPSWGHVCRAWPAPPVEHAA